jgi:hypothetical protein
MHELRRNRDGRDGGCESVVLYGIRRATMKGLGTNRFRMSIRIIVETICRLTTLLSVAIQKSCLGVLPAHGYSFQKQSNEKYRDIIGGTGV